MCPTVLALAPGTKVGDFDIVGALGAGGMGEVYRARDRQLGRDVALKILPSDFTADPDWRRRFEREARLLASLSHPNLATVHRFDADANPPYLVMELVPGDTLAARVAAGPLPVTEALQILRQVAAGLEAAHDAGIIHRDLKPSNIAITPDGVVRILDFGLAKSVRDDGDAASLTTMTAPPTKAGAVIGTAAFMSPEQARGQTVDRRTDIWAFGCVGYEVLCGRRAFRGGTPTETVAAVLMAEPDWSALPSNMPPRIGDLLRRCLDKDPARRLRDAHDLRLTIEDVQSASQSTPRPASDAGSGDRSDSALSSNRARAPKMASREMVAWMLAAAAVLAAAGLWWLGRNATGGAPALQRFVRLTDQAGQEDDPAVSPDGASIAFAKSVGGNWNVFVQRVGGHNPIVVAGDPARSERAPAFSPDGTTIAFHDATSGGIFVVGATGESVRRLTDFGFHPTWSPDGNHIAFCTEAAATVAARYTTSSLWIVDAKGGTPKKIYDGDAVQPSWSPSGARIAFMAVGSNAQRDLFTIGADGGRPVQVTDDGALDLNPAWSADGRFLYFASDRGGVLNVWRLGIDEASGQPRGVPVPVTNGVVATADEPTLSRDGTRLVFRSGVLSANPFVAPIDLAAGTIGEPKPVSDRTGILTVTSVSPNGRWLALTNQREAQEDLFVSRSDGSDFRRLTDDAFRDRSPVWSPDGSRLAFYSNHDGRGQQIWTINRDGSGLTQITDLNAELNFPNFSPTGDRIVATVLRDQRVLILDLSKPLPLRAAEELPNIRVGAGWLIAGPWSPDGRRLVGPITSASGGLGIGIYDFALSQAVKVADDPVTNTMWLADSRRIAFFSRGRVVVVDVASGQRRELLLPSSLSVSAASVQISPDDRFVYINATKSEADVWMAQIK